MSEQGEGRFAQIATQTSAFFAVQVLLLLVQLGYTAITSRVFDPEVFGAYAIATATAAFGSLIAVAGFTKAAARRQDDDVRSDRELLGACLAVSVAVAVVLVLAAPLVAQLWGDESAVGLTRLLSLGLIASAYAGVTSGYLRRLGRMNLMTMQSLVAGLVGIALGIIAVTASHETWSLAVMPLATPVVAAVMAAARLGERGLPSRPTAATADDVRFSFSSSGVSMANYLTYTVPTLVLSRVAGAAILGSWNRAVALAQVPLEVGTRSWITVTFPRFRHHRPGPHTVSVWTDLACGGAWLILPTVAVLAPAVQVAVGFILGPDWTVAPQIAAWLWLGGGVTAVYTLIGIAAESAGHFRVLWTAQLPELLIMATATLVLWGTGQWLALAVGVVLAAVAHLATTISAAAGQGLLDGRSVFTWLAGTCALAAVLVLPAVAADRLLAPLATLLVSVLTASLFLIATYLLRDRIPAVDRFLNR